MAKSTVIPEKNRPLPFGAELNDDYVSPRQFKQNNALFYESHQPITLCIGPSNDQVLRVVDTHAKRLDQLVVVYLEELHQNWSYICRDGNSYFMLTDDKGDTMALKPGLIYFRPGFAKEAGRLAPLIRELMAFLAMWPGTVLGRPEQFCPNNSKLFQLSQVARLAHDTKAAVSIPKSRVVKGSRLPAALNKGGRYIIKSLSNVRTDVLDAEHYRERLAEHLNHVPVLFQAVVAGQDMRVHTLNGRSFGVLIKKPKRANYRYHTRSDQLTPVSLDEKTQAFIKALLDWEQREIMGIDFLRQADGQLICLEANPSPGWSAFHEKEPVEHDNFLTTILKQLKAI